METQDLCSYRMHAESWAWGLTYSTDAKTTGKVFFDNNSIASIIIKGHMGRCVYTWNFQIQKSKGQSTVVKYTAIQTCF